jgi:plastocyanin
MYRSTIHFASGLLFVGFLLTTGGCNYNPPSAPDSSVPGPEGAVISIGPSGLTPSAVTITSGQSVTFVNSDSVAHEIVSTPVPTYDDCPAVNRVTRLEPGQTMQTGALTIMRVCGVIDLLRASDPRWQGSITVR